MNPALALALRLLGVNPKRPARAVYQVAVRAFGGQVAGGMASVLDSVKDPAAKAEFIARGRRFFDAWEKGDTKGAGREFEAAAEKFKP